ncbi:hypothetical protein HanPSC8_Chr13g0592581 [Helianthus annuus]|nr:hypothetical protein HanPSC8_Chr13g0592581 [Helianthus annuus]
MKPQSIYKRFRVWVINRLMVGSVVVFVYVWMLVRHRFESLVHQVFFLFLNFNTIFQIITLGPSSLTFNHIHFLGKKATRFYFALGHQND